MSQARLLAVVEVSKENRVVCQAEGCGHSVYKRIHVVRVGDGFTVLGSDCFSRLYGDVDPLPHYGTGEGRQLTDEERAKLAQNTAEFIAQLEAEHQEALRVEAEQAAAREEAMRQHAETLRQRQDELERQRLAAMKPGDVRLLGHQPRQVVTFDKEELARARAEVKERLRKQFTINPDQIGWQGLVEMEARMLVHQRRSAAPAPELF